MLCRGPSCDHTPPIVTREAARESTGDELPSASRGGLAGNSSMKGRARRFVLAVAVLMPTVGTPERSEATLIAYENLNYQPGSPLLGTNGSVGFDGSWRPGAFNASNFTN